MEKTTGIDIQMIEPEPEYEEGCVAMTSSAPKYWSRLGSSKSRTTEQQEMGKEFVMDMMMERQKEQLSPSRMVAASLIQAHAGLGQLSTHTIINQCT